MESQYNPHGFVTIYQDHVPVDGPMRLGLVERWFRRHQDSGCSVRPSNIVSVMPLDEGTVRIVHKTANDVCFGEVTFMGSFARGEAKEFALRFARNHRAVIHNFKSLDAPGEYINPIIRGAKL
jgi:hypothetical protein